VFAFGRAAFAGGAGDAPLRSSIAGMAATPSGDGYWLAARDGGVFAFGDAGFHGGLAELPLNRPVVDIASTPSGDGYWLASSDGGVFAFGNAPWLGAISEAPLNAPVTAIAATPSGLGYWLVGRDGAVFAFGDARWLGGASGLGLTRPVADAAPTPSGNGYWLAATDGGVFAFGDAGFHGSALGATERSVVGIAPTPSGRGYWLASTDGGVFAFGDAGFHGSAADGDVARTVVGIASGVGRAVPPPAGRLLSRFGWDVSWPQCGTPLPGGPRGYAIIGVTDGHLYDMNPCLAEQHRWSIRDGSLGGLYVNVNWPSKAAEPGLAARMSDACAIEDVGCQLYEWGRRGVLHAVDGATTLGVHAPMWWLDVETRNRWSGDTVANARVIQGAIDGLHSRGLRVGVYSTSYQWGVIAGAFSPGLPNWIAGPVDAASAARACQSGPTFGGGIPWMVQYPFRGFDGNLMCEAGAAEALRSFTLPPTPAVPEFPAPPKPRTRVLGAPAARGVRPTGARG
ncbi:MAG: hypothetical protein M3Q48_15450, partial [Actinomycetota bacterium]|nr:hypothetical protein [Actinomycetota bacterium]